MAEAPLRRPAARRPAAAARLDEVVGQEHLTGPDGAIGRMVAAGKLASMILWGPPGTGKTSIARLLADAVGLRFVAISAVFSGVADLKKIFAEARQHGQGRPAHLAVRRRDPPLQSRAAGRLPALCRGRHVTLVGATTENPSFELNAALAVALPGADPPPARRCALCKLLEPRRGADRRARCRSPPKPATRWSPAPTATAASCSTRPRPCSTSKLESRSIRPGSPRCSSAGSRSTTRTARAITTSSRRSTKAIRGSDPQAALYYLARMLTAGEEPLYVLRRLIRAAVEDIGLADPQALVQCLAAKDAYDFLGSPEGELAIVQACLYLATAPKSNAAYKAQKGGLAERQGDRLADAADEHPQRADQADEGHRLRQGL
jgi:putative ATPase